MELYRGQSISARMLGKVFPIQFPKLTASGDMVHYVITATTRSNFVLRPIHDVPPQQFMLSFSSGHFSLKCEDEDKEEYTRCEFPSFGGETQTFAFSLIVSGCSTPDVPWSCCYRFGILPPLPIAKPWSIFISGYDPLFVDLPWYSFF